MTDADLKRPIEILEGNMEQLGDVPIRLTAVESQIVELRADMRGGFSAIRTEMRELNAETRTEMRVLHEEVLSRITLIGELRTGSRRPRRTVPLRKKKQ